MGNKNEGYLGGIMGGESRVGSGTTTTGTQKTVQDLTLHSQLSLVGDKVDMGFTDSVSNAYFSLTPGSGYQYLEVRYNADSSNRKRFVLGLVEAASATANTQGQHSYSRGIRVDDSSLAYRAGSSLPSTYGSLDYILAMLLNLDTGDVYMSICDPGNAPVWVREDNTESTTFDVANPTFSGLDLTTLDTVFTQLSWNETYMNFNFGGNPLFDGEETSGNDSSTWYNDPPVSVVSFGQQEVTLKVANTGILSLEEAGTQTVGGTSGDDNWNDVSLLIRGDTLTDLSGNHTITNNGVTAGNTTYTKHSTSGYMSFDGTSDYISIPDDTSLEFGSGDFTIECWAYHVGSFDPYTSVFGNRASESHYGPFGMASGGGGAYDNQIRFFAGEGTGTTNSLMLIDPDAFPLNQWVHVAVTREGTTFTLWINGQSKVTGTGSWSVYNASEPLYIGKAVTTVAGSSTWNGNIEDFRITKGVARYTSNFTPPTESFPTSLPVGDLTLPQLSWGGITGRSVVAEGSAAVPGDDDWNDVSLLIRGDTLTDLSANGHTVSENGSTPLYYDTTTKKYASGSLTFNGSGDYVSVPDDPSLELGSGDFTIECWAYHSGTLLTKASIMGKRSDYSHKAPYLINADTTNPDKKMRFLASAGSNWDIIITDTHAFPYDQWVHVAVTRAGNVFTLWINGESKVTTTAAITLMDNSAPLYIGRGSANTGADLHDWNGNIEDFRITKGVARYTTDFSSELPTESFPTSLPVAGTPDTLVDTGIFTLEEIYELTKSQPGTPVYTFEMWGAGGGGGGSDNLTPTDVGDAGPGGSGAYVTGTLQGISTGDTITIFSGFPGYGGTGGEAVSESGGNGGGSSAIIVNSVNLAAVAGGGGGGGQAGGANSAADATGGRGGNSLDGSNVAAANVAASDGGYGGISGSSTTAGTAPTNGHADTVPPTKTGLMQDGGDGGDGHNGGAGNGLHEDNTASTHGGTGGKGGNQVSNEGAGGGGGGGYYGGSGGSGAANGSNQAQCGGGGGGGGSYVNSTYVTSESSAEGSYESGTAHTAAAVTQTAGSTATAYASTNGQGGAGAGSPGAPGDNGQPGLVVLYKDGVEVARADTGNEEVDYTLA